MLRSILHLDADAFFASVEQATDPRLRGRPIAVGGEKRGIIASASYEARKFGIYTPMPTVRARKLCPQLIVLPGDFAKYEEFSRRMFEYALDFTPEVEQSSIDEGYCDVSGARMAPVVLAERLQRAISQSLGITVSEGLGSNKLVSQIASKLRKPAAFEIVPHGQEPSFLAPLANKWLPGVGPTTAARLTAAGLTKIHHLAEMPLDFLQLILGKQAATIREYARGIDHRPVVIAQEAQKSFGEQETFAEDITDEEYLEAVLRKMADRLMAEIRMEGRTMRTLTVRVRYNDMQEEQRSESLMEPTDLETDLYGKLRSLLRAAWQRRVSVRLVGLRFTNLYEHWSRTELPMAVRGERAESHQRLAEAIDALRGKHGSDAILRGHDLRLRHGPRVEIPKGGGAAGSDRKRVEASSSPSFQTATYIPLNVRSTYSFLDSTLSPTQIVQLAKAQGMPAVGMADTGNLHGAVEFVQAAREAGIKPLLGAEMMVGGSRVLLYVETTSGYEQLCRLLSQPRRTWKRTDLAFTSGLIVISTDATLGDLFPGRFYQAISSVRPLSVGNHPRVACPRIHYGQPEDRQKFEILQSIRTLTLLRGSHASKRLGGTWHFRSGAEMEPLLQADPQCLQNTLEIAERCTFELQLGPPQFPNFHPPDGSTPRQFLRTLVMQGLRDRYGSRAENLQEQIDQELGIIGQVGYEEYFLVVWDLLQQCHAQGIEWITRGSAADSLVCYCLRISDVCPIRFGLYFPRFLNLERMSMKKLPDIDIDFPHDRKDDVVDLIFAKYGREFCAVVGGFSTFQTRSAFAEVAKVLGVAERDVRKFTEHFPWSFSGSWKPPDATSNEPPDLIKTLRNRPECADLPLEEEPYRTALLTAAFLDGFPRHAKMHPCGVVLSRQPMRALTPTFESSKGYPTTHFDMDAVETIGLVKLDILAQGGLAVMRDARATLAARGLHVDLSSLEPWEDAQVWKMIAAGGSRGVHHIESPAMVNLCRMTNVREIHGLVAIVSVIRPGAANEQKKLRFTLRYQDMEPVTFPHPSLEKCLADSYGLVIYEEHILQICADFAGLSAERADVLRRALGKGKHAVIAQIKEEFAAAALLLQRDPEAIAQVWELVSGFAGYAFCKAHSAAYGVEAYQAAWLKCYHPAAFMAAVLTHGKGFYDPLVYVLECLRLGLRFLPPSINDPGPQFTVRPEGIRVPITRAKGLREETISRILCEHPRGPFTSLRNCFDRLRPNAEELTALIQAGAFDEFGQSRTHQFWDAQQWQHHCNNLPSHGQLWLLPPPDLEIARLPRAPLQEPSRLQRLEWETELFGFAITGHPLDLFPSIAWDTYCPVSRLHEYAGQRITTCGLVVEQRTHHQVTGETMKFMTIADHTGMAETELFASTYRTYALATVRHPVLEIEATVEPFENGHGFSLRIHRCGAPRRCL